MLFRVLLIWCATSVVVTPLLGSLMATERPARQPATERRLRPVA